MHSPFHKKIVYPVLLHQQVNTRGVQGAMLNEIALPSCYVKKELFNDNISDNFKF